MRHRRSCDAHRLAFLLTLILLHGALRPTEAAPCQDAKEKAKRVVLLGNGLIEQGQFSGYLELELTLRSADHPVVCRNLGWSGDTVWGQARTKGYQNPGGLERLLKQTTEQKPELILIGYGLVESFKGEQGLKAFTEGYGKLLDALAKLTPDLVLLSPAYHENLGAPLPDPQEHNRNLELYGRAIENLARERKLLFIDLFHPLQKFAQTHPGIHATTNGILLNDLGYWLVASEVRRQGGRPIAPWTLDVGPQGVKNDVAGIKVTEFSSSLEGLKFQMVEDLPFPIPGSVADAARQAVKSPGPILRAGGLRDGEWTLTIDGKEILSATAQKWKEGVTIEDRPSVRRSEALRQALIRENQLFARRWNPINDWPAHYSYIAPDFALYDGLLTQQEERIWALVKPSPEAYHLALKTP